MTNQEHAFIEGFVKRAAERGIKYSNAVSLLKSAVMLKEAARGEHALKYLTNVLKDRNVDIPSPRFGKMYPPAKHARSGQLAAEAVRQARKAKAPVPTDHLVNGLNNLLDR